KNCTDDDQDDGEGVPEAEAATAEFAEKEEKPDSGDHGGTHQASNGAAAAGAAVCVAHATFSSKTAGFGPLQRCSPSQRPASESRPYNNEEQIMGGRSDCET